MYGREKEVWVDNQPEEYTLSMALAAGWLEDIWDMIDAQASEDEMLAKGYDPDMVNEYCCDSIQDRSSVDALYGPQDAALIALKKKRAAKILKKEDPGMLTAEEKKIATVIPRPRRNSLWATPPKERSWAFLTMLPCTKGSGSDLCRAGNHQRLFPWSGPGQNPAA